MGGALRTPDILLNSPRPIHWSSLEHPRTESANAVSFADWGEQERCASDARWRRNAPARKALRNGSNKSEREPTSGRSINYASGHLIRVFRDIGRIFSLLFLLSHPSPIGHPAEREGSKAIVGCCARAASGHPAAAPTTSVMNSRRLIQSPRRRPPAACPARSAPAPWLS